MADLGEDFIPPPLAPPASPEVQLAEAMEDAGLTPPSTILLDGELHRFSGNGKQDKSSWYVGFADGIPAGRFGDWRLDLSLTWRADLGRSLSPMEEILHAERMAEAKRIRDAARDQRHEEAALTAEAIWDNAGPAPADHPYLVRKQVAPHGARLAPDGRLLLPLFDAEGFLTSVQYIGSDGRKLFLAGGKAGGSYWWIGDMEAGGPVYLAEGFATAASIHTATGQPCWIAYSASNLVPVATALRARIDPLREIVIVSDTPGEHNTGPKNAHEAAERCGARVVQVPDGLFLLDERLGEKPVTDANDYVNAGHDLAALLRPAKTAWLVPADELSRKPEPVRWLVRRWLQRDALIMVHGPQSSGKTFLLLDWCLHLAADLPEWAGLTVHPGPVVYLAGEGCRAIGTRIAAWKQHHGVTRTRMHVSKSGCDLNKPSGLQKTMEAIREIPAAPVLIVVDTVHRFYAGSESNTEDIKTMIDACGMLQEEFGCAVALVHHPGVSEEAQHRGRGSGAWGAAVEIEISVSRTSDGMAVVQRKAKDSELADDLFFDLQTITLPWVDEDGEAVTSLVPVPGVAPVKTRRNDATETARQEFERAYWEGGADRRDTLAGDGLPYVNRSAARDKWREIYPDWSEGNLRNQLLASKETGKIGRLIAAGLIAEHDHGWVIVDPDWVSALNLAEGSKS